MFKILSNISNIWLAGPMKRWVYWFKDASSFMHTRRSNEYSQDEICNRVNLSRKNKNSNFPIRNNGVSKNQGIKVVKWLIHHTKASNCYRILFVRAFTNFSNSHSYATVIAAWCGACPFKNCCVEFNDCYFRFAMFCTCNFVRLQRIILLLKYP